MVKLKEIGIQTAILGALAVFLPLVFIPTLPNPFTTPKLALLFFACASLVFVFAVGTRPEKVEKAVFSKTSGGIALFILFLTIYNLATGANLQKAFFDPGISSIYTLSAIVILFVSALKRQNKTHLTNFLYVSAFTVSLVILVAYLQVFSKFNYLPEYVRSLLFTPIGSSLQTLIFLIPLAPLGLNFLRAKEHKTKMFGYISLAIIAAAILIQANPARAEAAGLLGFGDSWKIALETMVGKPQGVGPGNYPFAFDLYKSPRINVSDNWNIRYGSARNTFFTFVTEFGVFGLLLIILMVKSVASAIHKAYIKNQEEKLVGWNSKLEPEVFSVMFLIAISLLFPVGLVGTVVFFALWGILTETSPKDEFVISGKGSSLMARSMLGVKIALLILPFILIYYFTNGIIAEYAFQKAYTLLSQGKGREAYDLIKEKIIPLSPNTIKYRSFYAQTNLAITKALSQKPEENKDVLPQLVQQAIREAKAAAALGPQDAQNWMLLGNIYASITPFASDANTFALQAYNQAAKLDPFNPSVRMAIGGIYMASKDYERARDAFALAVLLKPNSADAHYNLALSYKELEETGKYKEELTAASLLFEPSSDAYKKIREELAALETEKE